MLGAVQGKVQHQPAKNEKSQPDGDLIGHEHPELKSPPR